MKKATPFFFYFTFYGANAAFMPYLVLFYQSLDFTGAQIGLLASLSPLLFMFGAPIWTGLADTTRRHRLVMGAAILVTVLCSFVMPWLHSFLPVLLLMIVFAFFGSPVNSFADSATMNMLEGKKELYGRLRLGGTFGWGISSLLVGPLIEDHGLKLAFWIFSGVMFLALLVSQSFTFEQTETRQSVLRGARILLAESRYRIFLLMALVCGIGFSTANSYLFPYMAELNATESLMGLAMTISTVSELPVLLFSNRILRWLGPRRMLVLGMAATAVRLLLYAAIHTPKVVIISQLMNGLTYAMVWVAGVSYANQTAPPGLSATGQGLFGAMTFGVGASIGGFAGSMLLEALGGRGMFLVVGVFFTVSLGVLLLLERRYPPVAKNLKLCE